MQNLVFSLNATVPVFLLMILGIFLRKIGWISEEFASEANKFVFRIPLPMLLFSDLASVDFREVWDTKFVLFCFGATLASILAAALISEFLKERSLRGEFIQASYRSSAALLGTALIKNIYGNAGMAPLMILASVPLYNAIAVVVLSVFKPEVSGLNKNVLLKTGKGIVTNPIIIGIICGICWSMLKLPMPAILDKFTSNVGSMSTPLGLIAMGAGFDFKKALGNLKPAAVASFIKLAGFCTVFLPLGVLLGFRQEKLIAILIMLGSATTVSSYVMARNMGHEGVLTSTVIMITTVLSGFTITFWLFLLRSMTLI